MLHGTYWAYQFRRRFVRFANRVPGAGYGVDEPARKAFVDLLAQPVDMHVDQIAARYSDGRQYKLDGLSVEYPDWHFNVRPSNTEPLLRLNLEATRPELMAQKRDEVVALIRS